MICLSTRPCHTPRPRIIECMGVCQFSTSALCCGFKPSSVEPFVPSGDLREFASNTDRADRCHSRHDLSGRDPASSSWTPHTIAFPDFAIASHQEARHSFPRRRPQPYQSRYNLDRRPVATPAGTRRHQNQLNHPCPISDTSNPARPSLRYFIGRNSPALIRRKDHSISIRRLQHGCNQLHA